MLPVDLHATLKGIADRDRRSLHQEIIFALEQFAAEQAQSSQRVPGPEGAATFTVSDQTSGHEPR